MSPTRLALRGPHPAARVVQGIVAKQGRRATRKPEGIELKPWLDHLKIHVSMTRHGRDPEGVHQLRVAVARLRVWLELGGWRALHDDLRWLRTKAAPVRDLDVQLARDLPPAYGEKLQAEHERARNELQRALQADRLRALLSALAVLPPLTPRRAQQGLARFARRTLALGRELPRDGYECLHAVRRSVRRVRFALEWLGEPADEIVKLQSALGTFGDAWVALRYAEEHGKGHDMAEHKRTLERELRDAAHGARTAWRRARPALEALA